MLAELWEVGSRVLTEQLGVHSFSIAMSLGGLALVKGVLT